MPRGMGRSGHAREVPDHDGELPQGYERVRAGERMGGKRAKRFRPSFSSHRRIGFYSIHSPLAPIPPFLPSSFCAVGQVFSDEFEQDGRSFEDGADPRWTAIDKNDCESVLLGSSFVFAPCELLVLPNLFLVSFTSHPPSLADTNEALHYYRPQNVRTANGALGITSELKSNLYRAFDEDKEKYFADAKHVQSGMVQGWNKFCMTGGIVEFSAKLPGDPSTGGLWPALWMLGNLARATYVGSSNYIWPYSYDKCDEKNRVSQKISACSKVGHFGMDPGVGRGSPEIDILEAMMGSMETLPSTNITRPYFSSSLQIAPGYDGVRPNMGKMPKKVSEMFSPDVLIFRPVVHATI